MKMLQGRWRMRKRESGRSCDSMMQRSVGECEGGGAGKMNKNLMEEMVGQSCEGHEVLPGLSGLSPR